MRSSNHEPDFFRYKDKVLKDKEKKDYIEYLYLLKGSVIATLDNGKRQDAILEPLT